MDCFSVDVAAGMNARLAHLTMGRVAAAAVVMSTATCATSLEWCAISVQMGLCCWTVVVPLRVRRICLGQTHSR